MKSEEKFMEKEKEYFDELLKKSKVTKKQVAVYFDDLMLERIDMSTKIFSTIRDSKSFSRNILIEEAVKKYLLEAEKYLFEEHGIVLDEMIKEEQYKKFDTVIFSSKEKGFKETFLGEKEKMCWYPCRISEEREKNLRYIAIYRGQPESAITHYAKIEKIEFDSKKNCKVCYFKGEPSELPNRITLGEKESCFFLGTKYTKLENLLNAKKANEINFI
jgi:hypothetical protein